VAAVDTADVTTAATEVETAIVAVTTEEASEQVASTWAPATIDAIEIEGDRSFFAGAGPDGAIVRLYVDDTYVADATVEGGRWLVEGGAVLTKPNQRIRADLLAPGSADVVGRSEVDFVVDLPGAESPVQVADTPAAQFEDTASGAE